MQLHENLLRRYAHPDLSGSINSANERNTLLVVVLTLTAMFVEVGVGFWSGSMALLADGWHMGTHALALGITYATYRLARRYEKSDRFSFGTGKFGSLAGYTSALGLGVAGLWIIIESVERLFNRVDIAYNEAIIVTIVGLCVNLASIFILKTPHSHAHDGHDHENEKHVHEHDEGAQKADTQKDHNYRAAYLHVLADALTSVMALIALFSGKFFNWSFLDPIVGIAGGLLISRWAYGLIKTTAATLLDASAKRELFEKAKALIEQDGDSRVADIHIWRIGTDQLAGILSIVSGQHRAAPEYRERLKAIEHLAHVNVEVIPCGEPGCGCAK